MANNPQAPVSIYADSYYRSGPLIIAEPRPFGPAVLVAVGGLLVILEGLITLIFGAILSSSGQGLLGSAGVLQGILVSIVGVLLFGTAYLIFGEPHHHVANGVLALLFVFLSLFFGFGGFYLGALFAGIGAIWAILWHPPLRIIAARVSRE